MLPRIITIEPSTSPNSLFLKDPKADIYLALGERIFPLHRQYLTECQTIKSVCGDSNKFLLVEEPLDVRLDYK